MSLFWAKTIFVSIKIKRRGERHIFTNIIFPDLHNIPRRIVSGVLSHHIYLEIEKSSLAEIMDSINRLEIENVFIVASAANAGEVLGEVGIADEESKG